MAYLVKLDGKDHIAIPKTRVAHAIDKMFGRQSAIFVQRFREQRVLKRIARGAPMALNK